MKTPIRLSRLFATLLFTAGALCACGDDSDPQPVPPVPVPPDPATLDQRVEHDGSGFTIRTVLEEDIDGMQCVFLCADAGVTDGAELLGSEKEYVLLAVDEKFDETIEEQTQATVDLKTFGYPFRVLYMKQGKSLFEVTDRDKESLTRGSMQIAFNEQTRIGTLDFQILLASGSYLYGNASWYVDEPDPVVKDDTITIDGEEIPILSAFVYEYAGFWVFTVSPVEGADSIDWIEKNKVDNLQMLVLPPLLNKSIDFMTEKGIFTLLAKLGEISIEATTRYRDDLQEGTCEFGIDGTHATLKIDMTLSDGREISVRSACDMEPVVGQAPR